MNDLKRFRVTARAFLRAGHSKFHARVKGTWSRLFFWCVISGYFFWRKIKIPKLFPLLYIFWFGQQVFIPRIICFGCPNGLQKKVFSDWC